ncbi:DUF799 domain-containing protein [Acinetobacter pullicarnis]|uniref:DUF799 domain-containing protein n=1 Tax=Acinetobacter pullicarnis TaxID=2576829 RepID=UPI0011200FB7|nr:GNA1162 family protein [Acinetobacter pullicarnis]
MKINLGLIAILAVSSLMLGGCASTMVKPERDSSVYRSHMPKSILVLPPINDSPDVKATYSYWPTVTVPVAEAGYYVFPMALVDNMFRENGVTNGADAQSIAPQKLHEIFGADAGLYIRIKDYGSKYQIIQSVATVAVEAKLVDLRTGELLWSGEKKISQSSDDGNSGLLGAMISAVVQQVSSSLNDNAYPIANSVSAVLFSPNPQGAGLLYGPRSPHFQQQAAGNQ